MREFKVIFCFYQPEVQQNFFTDIQRQKLCHPTRGCRQAQTRAIPWAQRQGTNSCTELSYSYPGRKHLGKIPWGSVWYIYRASTSPTLGLAHILRTSPKGHIRELGKPTGQTHTIWGLLTGTRSFPSPIYPRQGWPVKVLGFWGGWVWATYLSGRSQISVMHTDSNDSVEAGWLAGPLRCLQRQLPPRPVCDPAAFIWGAR